MAKHQELTHSRLLELLAYDQATGVFTWKQDRAPTCKAGTVAGSPHDQGYIQISIDWRLYKAHRLAWFYVHGRWPERFIDHLNGEVDDNRLANLREATPKLNTENQRKARSDSKSGLMGVRWHPNGAWQARIGVAGRQKHLGLFKTPEEAHAAYLQAKRELHEGCTI